MYSRADLSRTVALVVAPFLPAVSTSAAAREFRAADTQSRETIEQTRAGALDLNRTRVE